MSKEQKLHPAPIPEEQTASKIRKLSKQSDVGAARQPWQPWQVAQDLLPKHVPVLRSILHPDEWRLLVLYFLFMAWQGVDFPTQLLCSANKQEADQLRNSRLLLDSLFRQVLSTVDAEKDEKKATWMKHAMVACQVVAVPRQHGNKERHEIKFFPNAAAFYHRDASRIPSEWHKYMKNPLSTQSFDTFKTEFLATWTKSVLQVFNIPDSDMLRLRKLMLLFCMPDALRLAAAHFYQQHAADFVQWKQNPKSPASIAFGALLDTAWRQFPFDQLYLLFCQVFHAL